MRPTRLVISARYFWPLDIRERIRVNIANPRSAIPQLYTCRTQSPAHIPREPHTCVFDTRRGGGENEWPQSLRNNIFTPAIIMYMEWREDHLPVIWQFHCTRCICSARARANGNLRPSNNVCARDSHLYLSPSWLPAAPSFFFNKWWTYGNEAELFCSHFEASLRGHRVRLAHLYYFLTRSTPNSSPLDLGNIFRTG
jgi:hypothetical protein